MGIKIALAGNPNSGKTTLFNVLTGSNQFVGNWPGVTVEKKEGILKGHSDVTVTDLPGIYSLSPYTPEEIVARSYLLNEAPDVILNIIDASNLERNLYLTTQLTELGIPVVAALNMIDVVRRNGDTIDVPALSERLGCTIVEISALKNEGLLEAAEAAIKAAEIGKTADVIHFPNAVEDALEEISSAAADRIAQSKQRWYAVKLFERDERLLKELELDTESSARIEKAITAAENELDDDAEALIADGRYNCIERLLSGIYVRKNSGKRSVSDKIDKVVMHRFFGLPIFALIMIAVYFISVTTVGSWASDWANDGLFGEGWFISASGKSAYNEDISAWEALGSQELTKPVPADYKGYIKGIPVLAEEFLDKIDCSDWLSSLVLDGIIGGVGSVLGFVPQLLVLFMFLAILEACGYMARVAFIMDRIFRRFGLSGKSFIPILIGTGCGVPGIMASRTIENVRDRRMTIITTTFIPCGAKLPVISMIAASLFGGAWWVGPSAYFMGIAAILISGVILKKTKLFAGEGSPFVMELPSYHLPTVTSVLHSMWERGWSFIKKAGTIILLASIIIWSGSHFGWEGGSFGFGIDLALEDSVIGRFGSAVKWIFAPLGFDTNAAAVATVMGLVAKEEIVGVFGVLNTDSLTQLSGYAFLAFNLLCAPCFAAMGAIRREMNSPRWTAFAIGYQCLFAYITSFCIFQLGSLFSGKGSIIGSVTAFAVVAAVVFLLLRPIEESRPFPQKAASRR